VSAKCEVYSPLPWRGTPTGPLSIRYNTRMRTHPDVLIVGGGVIGLTTAYYLAQDGARVRVLDRSAPGMEASWAGAGIVPPGNVAGAATAYDRLRAASSAAFQALSADLRERTGIDNGYRCCGGIEVFDSAADATTRLWGSEGIEFQPLTTGAARDLEPELRVPPTASVYLLPGMGQVRNPWHLRALIAACERAGVRIDANCTVVRWRTEGSNISAAIGEDGSEYPAGLFLVASGAWSERLLTPLGLRPGIHPVRGQMVLFRSDKPLLRRVIGFGKRYLVPREDGRILVGSTEEPEAGFEKRSTDSGVAMLQLFATDVVPALSGAVIEKTWAGLRPGTPDGWPILGGVPGWANAFVATGHYRAGIQLSPATGRIMADLAMGRSPTMPIDDFRADRPPVPPAPMPFRS
jgi:glycine oxidase